MENQSPSTTRERSPQIFGPCLLWPNGGMDRDINWYGGTPRPTRHCVRCGPSYSQKKGHTYSHPIFGPCLLWPNGRIDEDAAWYGSRPRLRPHCTRRGLSSRERGTAPPLLFGPCLLWPRSPISATAELWWLLFLTDFWRLFKRSSFQFNDKLMYDECKWIKISVKSHWRTLRVNTHNEMNVDRALEVNRLVGATEISGCSLLHYRLKRSEANVWQLRQMTYTY